MNNRTGDVPGDVYVQFVRSLFESRSMLLVGALCHAIVTLMAYVRTDRLVFAILSILLLGVGIWRFSGLRYDKEELRQLDVATARRWELDYVLKGALQGFLLGAFGFVSMYLYPDQFAELGALGINLASLVTVVGRNYGSARMVAVFTTTMLFPMAVALLMRGELPYVVLGLLMLPFGLIVVKIAAEVRKILSRVVLERRNVSQLAQRFDRALNTMSHGLVMFGPYGRIVVANAQAADFLGLQSSERLVGRSLRALLLRGVAGKLMSIEDFRYAEAQLTRALKKGRGHKVLLKLLDGRHFEFSAREGPEELGVITFEEVTQRVDAESRIRSMARFDSLTNLANRAYFSETITDLMATGDVHRLCGLIVMDMDDFKSVNDTLGHPAGDGLIYALAERLSQFASENVRISRFGGDEFMIFINHLEDDHDLSVQLDEMFERIQGEVDVAGHNLRIQISAGAVVAPVRDSDMDSLMVKADLALYNAKEEGKNGWRLFEEKMEAAFRNRQLLKSELRNAIRTGALRVVYQPIVDMSSLHISGCEALCRWDHRELGPVSPSVFIPLAEEMGLVSEISSQVLDAACQECARWPDHLSVSVNLSAKDFYTGAVIDRVRDAVTKAGIAPQRLEIEVTETALLDDSITSRHYLEELKKLGVRIALDDFGTGYSSLSYLNKLPLDRVKIDGSFLRDVTVNTRSRQLLKGVVELARSLDLAVTVEGVESFEQLKLLNRSIKPDRVQGFLFGSALSSSGIETMSNAVWSMDGTFHRHDLTVHR